MRLNRALLSASLAIAAALHAPSGDAQQPARPAALALTSAPQLGDCAPVSLAPCMSATVTPVTAAGVPAPVNLPPAAQLASAFTLTGASGQGTPFYASAGTGPDAAQHTNVVLLLIDISGSMREPMGSTSRFEAAKGAIAQFLDGMQAGSDPLKATTSSPPFAEPSSPPASPTPSRNSARCRSPARRTTPRSTRLSSPAKKPSPVKLPASSTPAHPICSRTSSS